MKLHIFTTALLFMINTLTAQAQYQVIEDVQHPGSRILKGLISKDILQNDSSYSWYAENQKLYKPDSLVLTAFERNKEKVNYIIFGGTWCDDTRFILPKFFKLQENAGISNEHITLIGVDRQKQASANLSAAFKVMNVPTIIVMKDGKEIGRVVEYGKTGKWDAELAGILNQ